MTRVRERIPRRTFYTECCIISFPCSKPRDDNAGGKKPGTAVEYYKMRERRIPMARAGVRRELSETESQGNASGEFSDLAAV